VPFRKGNGLTLSRSASQTRTQPLPNLLVTKHPFMPILFLGSGMNLTHGFVILCSYRVGNEPQSELGSWNSQGAEPARTKSFNSFYTFQILFYVHAFFSPPSCIICMFLPSVDSFALSKANRRKEEIVAAFSIDFFPLHSESHKLTFN